MADVRRMSEVRGRHARGVPYEADLERRLQDPEFRRAYEELKPEFEIIRQVIALRNQREMTQTELAERAGTKQSCIARMESKGQIANLHLLQRVAEALDARVEVRLVPRKAAVDKTVAKRTARSAPAGRRGKSVRT